MKRECIVCKKEIKINVLNRKKKYCSSKCFFKLYRQSEKYKSYMKRKRKHYNKLSREFYNKGPLKYREKRYKYMRSDKGKEYGRLYYYKNKEKILIRKYDRDKLNIKKEDCIKCGAKENIQIHHIDYENKVSIFLCRKCHLKEHNKRCLI